MAVTTTGVVRVSDIEIIVRYACWSERAAHIEGVTVPLPYWLTER